MENPLKLIYKNTHLLILLGIIILAVVIRWSSADFTSISDYDPWWFFRHTQEILNNNMVPPKWDLLSYFPGGRPVDYYEGWSYTNAIAYKITEVFRPGISLTRFAGLFVTIFAGLCAIPAYFVGKYVTNKWGGLVTALFGTVTVISITRSLAGYMAADAADVLYTFIVVLATLYTMDIWKDFSMQSLRTKKSTKYIFSLLITVFSYWLFATNFNNSWYIYYVFVAFIPLLLFFRVLESIIARTPVKFGHVLNENKGLILSIILIGVVGEAVTLTTLGWPFNTGDPIGGILTGFNFISGQALLVNISIAELQPLNVFSVQFLTLLQNIGFIPIFLGLFGLPLMTIFKLFKKWYAFVAGAYLVVVTLLFAYLISQAQQHPEVISTSLLPGIIMEVGYGMLVLYVLGFSFYSMRAEAGEIHTAEYFTIVWMLVAFWLITRGIRLSLLFSLAVAAGSGFVVGNLATLMKNKKNIFLHATLLGLIIFGLIWHVSENVQASLAAAQGYDIGQNWVDALNWIKDNTDQKSLIVTWWDPGHIIAGFTGRPVMADGAHCTPESCYPYNHNIRIQDMGFAFSTSSESDSIQILEKYQQLTPDQCQQLKQKFGSAVPDAACDKISSMYLIASADLIGKYYWLSYFGSCLNKYGLQTGQSCYTLSPPDFKSIGDELCPAGSVNCNFVQLGLSNYGLDNQGGIAAYYYGGGTITLAVRNSTLIPVLNNKYVASEMIFFQNGQMFSKTFNTSETVAGTVWVDPSFQYVVYMNPIIRNSVFTDLFFFNGEDLKNFQLVYNNGEVKIFKVNL